MKHRETNTEILYTPQFLLLLVLSISLVHLSQLRDLRRGELCSPLLKGGESI